MKRVCGIFISGLIILNTAIKINGAEVQFDKELNPTNNYTLQRELDKVSANVKDLLKENNVEIQIHDKLCDNYQDGVVTYGVYNWDYNTITIDSNASSIEYATIHEIGHALDDILKISSMENIQYSYDESEVIYENKHFNKNVEEYVAQSIQEYYDNNLNTNTNIYSEIKHIINEI